MFGPFWRWNALAATLIWCNALHGRPAAAWSSGGTPLFASVRSKDSWSVQSKPQRIIHRFNTFLNGQASKTADSTPPSPPQFTGVVAPLTYRGPYPCLALRFPHLRRKNNEKGENDIVLNFALDTGANINAVATRVVNELQIPSLANHQKKGMSGLPQEEYASVLGVTGTAVNASNALYRLGDCTIHGFPPEQANMTFLYNLTVLARPSPPQTDGVLGLPFLSLFVAGVELDWYGTDGDPPTVILYFGNPKNNNIAPPESALVNMTQVRLQLLVLKTGAASSLSSWLSPTQSFSGSTSPIPLGLLAVNLQLEMKEENDPVDNNNNNNNNVTTFWALLDTGSPATVVTQDLAARAGIEKDTNLFVRIAGSDETLADTALSKQRVSLSLLASNSNNNDEPPAEIIPLGAGHVLTGSLPILEVLSTGSVVPPVEAILGLDFLTRNLCRILLRTGAPPPALWVQQISAGLPRYKT